MVLASQALLDSGLMWLTLDLLCRLLMYWPCTCPTSSSYPMPCTLPRRPSARPRRMWRGAACTVIVDVAEGCSDALRKKLLPVLQVRLYR